MSQKELGRIVKDLFHLFKKEDNPDKESQETIANKAFKEMDVDSDGKVTEEEFVRACLSQETISKMLALKVIDVFIWQERNLAFPNSWWSEEKPMKLKTWFQLILLFTHHLYYSNNYSKKQCSIFSLSPKAVDLNLLLYFRRYYCKKSKILLQKFYMCHVHYCALLHEIYKKHILTS